MDGCVFCNIIAGKNPGEIVHRDERVTAFRDIHPAAATHILIVPNRHIDSVNELTGEDEALMGYLFTVAQQIARKEGVDRSGYRLIVNTGPQYGQTVFHLHMHLLGGQRNRYPIG